MSVRTQAAAASAKQFIIGRIIEQAAQDSIQLSSVEKTMLDFAEPIHDPALQAASDAFDAQCDSDEYETKIAKLISRAYKRDKRLGNEEAWKRPLADLSNVDCYLLVMIDQAGLEVPGMAGVEVPGSWRLIIDKKFILGILPEALVGVAGLVFFLTPLSVRLVPNMYVRGVLFVLWIGIIWLVAQIQYRKDFPKSD